MMLLQSFFIDSIIFCLISSNFISIPLILENDGSYHHDINHFSVLYMTKEIARL